MTMFAPTVIGSPVRNAVRIIARHERSGRGYYSGVLALVGLDEYARETLDAPILIRTAYLTPDGLISTPVGATLVRHSLPADEVAETHAKAAAVLRALGVLGELPVAPVHAQPADTRFDSVVDLGGYPGVSAALAARNDFLAQFWLTEQPVCPQPGLRGRTAVIIDAEDDWTAMPAHVLVRLAMTVTVSPWFEVGNVVTADVVIAGPGPGIQSMSGTDESIFCSGSSVSGCRQGVH